MLYHRLNKTDWSDYEELILPYSDDPYIKLMEDFIQHGSITTYSHVFSVARTAFILNRFLCMGADEKILIRGSILHDFFLYDWHGTDQGKTAMTEGIRQIYLKDDVFRSLPKSRITKRSVGIGPGNWTHSYKHALIACENAGSLFSICEKEKNMIRCHMWPLPPHRIPNCREAWILCMADKYCSLHETLFKRRGNS